MKNQGLSSAELQELQAREKARDYNHILKGFDIVVQGRSLKKGMLVQATYNSSNYGVGYYEILSVVMCHPSDDKNPIETFDSVKEALKFAGVTTLTQLEAWEDKNSRSFYVVTKGVLEDKSYPHYYLYSDSKPTRWCRGSGAEAVGFKRKSPPQPTSEAEKLSMLRTHKELSEDIWLSGQVTKAYREEIEAGDFSGFRSLKVQTAIKTVSKRYVFVFGPDDGDGSTAWYSVVSAGDPPDPSLMSLDAPVVARMVLELPASWKPTENLDTEMQSGDGWPDLAELANVEQPEDARKGRYPTLVA